VDLASYHANGLPGTRAGQLEHSRQHREGGPPHPVWEPRCEVADRIIAIEQEVPADTGIEALRADPTVEQLDRALRQILPADVLQSGDPTMWAAKLASLLGRAS
jgi:hypothetical protein